MSDSSRPIIGVTGPDVGGDIAWICTHFMIWLAGGKAVRITPNRFADVSELHGLVLGGGADIDPKRYKGEKLVDSIKKESKKVRHINMNFMVSIGLWLLRRFLSIKSSRGHLDAARDEMEFTLLKECVEKEIPVLGICRGGQLINVYWGGTLYQDISSFYVEEPQLRTVRPRKLIHIMSGTTLARILDRSQAKVNSLHDQSVKDLGKDLRVSARETNGVVQAIEHRNLPFMIGVQWHPEFMPMYPEQRRFFRQLVQAARVHRELCPADAPCGALIAH
jgi:putative glutamine amidotransferase